MKPSVVILVFFVNSISVKSRMIPKTYIPQTEPPVSINDRNFGWKEIVSEMDKDVVPQHEKVLDIKSQSNPSEFDSDDVYNNGVNLQNGPQEKCAVLVISNQGHTSMQQSLLRKYRYNKYGELIPSSVQYFIKFPQGKGGAILVPLKDEAFSPSGGFVRYYKEVPPIPRNW